VWDRNGIAERRDGSGMSVTARLYRHALQENGAARYLTRDHVMNVREVTDASVAIHARYEYTPYGSITNVTGTSADAAVAHTHGAWSLGPFVTPFDR
jgi:hypothetical protein